MWIRIRNKEALVYANNFYIRANEVGEKYGISYFDGDSFVNLGFYKSKERAIEVLDEIQKLLIAMPRTEIPFNNIVYQMPEV